MEIITSRQNEKIIYANSLHDRKCREKERLFIFEGKKLFLESVSRGVKLKTVFYTADNAGIISSSGVCPTETECIQVSDSVYEKISSEKSPSGIFCIAKPIDKFHKFATIYNNHINGSKIIIESMRDPGNLGTVIRTAAALALGEIILSADCADIYGEKAVRAAMGALFSQRITVCENLKSAAEALEASGYSVYAAALSENTLSLGDVKPDGKAVFVVGNEGHGISKELQDACTASVKIPMRGDMESLNAASAATILMWECTKTAN